jgi:superfamily II DNA/RNA helicase
MVLFSATSPKQLVSLARKALDKLDEVIINGSSKIAPDTAQRSSVAPLLYAQRHRKSSLKTCNNV